MQKNARKASKVFLDSFQKTLFMFLQISHINYILFCMYVTFIIWKSYYEIRRNEIYIAELSERSNDSNKFAPLIALHDRSIMRAWCEPSWWMKESEYSKDSDWISPPSKGERLGFTFDPLVSCCSSSFLSLALRQSANPSFFFC